MSRLITLVYLFHVFTGVNAQSRTIVGRVLDKESHKPVYNAAIIVYGSSIGTVSNIQGFFQLELAKGFDELFISHVSFEESKIKVPTVDKFSIELVPLKIRLKSLNLNNFPLRIDKSTRISADRDKDNFNILEQNASYRNGLENFYKDLGTLITLSENFEKNDFIVDLHFKVTTQGLIDDVKLIPLNSINSHIIIESISKLNNWHPAVQNNLPTEQSFALKVFFDEKAEIFGPVDISANPLGGYKEFYKFVGDEMRYPAEARKMGIEGRVYACFVVEIDGSLSNIEIVKGIGAGCDEEVKRVISKSSNWSPALKDSLPVKQRIVLPVTFSFDTPKQFENYDSDSISKQLSDVYITAIGIERNSRSLGYPVSIQPRIQEVLPEFPGGAKKMVKFIEENKKQIADDLPPNRLGDKVIIGFNVDKNGKINNLHIEESLGDSFDDEALRLYSTMPNWTPAKIGEEPIEKDMKATVYFGITSNNKRISASNNYRKGVDLFTREKYEKSILLFTKAIEENPSNLDYYFNRASNYLKLNDIDKACIDLRHIKDYDQEALFRFKEFCNNPK